MKNILILIVFGAVFLHFYPQPKLEHWYLEQKTVVLSSFSEATDTKVRLKADKIYSDLTPEFDHFNENEQAYLKEITTDRNSVKSFFAKYCQENKHNPKFHATNQAKVCSTITKYQSLF